MTYWLDLFTPYTWNRFREHGGNVSGFRPRQRKTAFERVRSGDILLCYLVKLSRWCGILEVISEAFEDTTPIFADENDPFPIRFKVNTRIALDFENAIPIEEASIWQKLTFTKDLVAGSRGWAQLARLRQSLIQIGDEDGRTIERALHDQARLKRRYELDAADRRRISQRTVIRTEQGEIEVEVPERDEALLETQAVPIEPEIRDSVRVQAKVAQLGATLGFGIWLPPGDRARTKELMPAVFHDKFVNVLPLNFDTTTLKTIENIDVIWLQRRAIMHAFEIEHTTAIYSGLLRMADLLALQPRIQIGLHIIAPSERREQVRREIIRPVFSVLDGGPMTERCSFLSYESIDQLLKKPDLAHMRETVLEDYEEFFEF